jgi:uncharacterized membrane protein
MRMLYHPLIVHFPVALWLTSFLFDLLYARTKQPFFRTASNWLIGLGLFTAAASVISGFVDYLPLVREGVGQAFVDRHKWHSLTAYGSTTMYLGILLARWRWRPQTTVAYLGPALVGAVLIAIVGYLGGEIRRVM